MNTFATVALLYGPLVLCVSLAVMTFRIRTTSVTTFTAQPLGIFGVSFPLKNQILIKSLMILSSIGCLSLYLFYDYSVFFPAVLQMDVYFDQAGVVRTADEIFSKAEQKETGMVRADEAIRQHYFGVLDTEARLALGKEASFFLVSNGNVHSTGRTTFKVKKINGWQRYHIEESKGELTHVLDAAHVPETEFVTLFDKLPTAEDYLEPSISELFLKGEVILQPRFRESLAEYRTSRSVTFNIVVVGFTKVFTIPWPHYSSTVYCADIAGVGFVPIAYAIYRQE